MLPQSSRNVGLNRLRLRVLCFSAYLGKDAGFDSEIFKSKEAGGGPSLGGWGFGTSHQAAHSLPLEYSRPLPTKECPHGFASELLTFAGWFLGVPRQLLSCPVAKME